MDSRDREIEIALIYGSARDGRFCDVVANWAAERIVATDGFSVTRIDPVASDAEPGEVRRRIARAEAFVVVTPEYNHGYPAPLKALIDSFNSEWHAKPVAFVSYGGVSGGLRAVEQLRLVFAEVHAVAIRDSVSFANAWTMFDAAGQIATAGAAEAADAAMALMLRRLGWWARALRVARSAIPYAQAAA